MKKEVMMILTIAYTSFCVSGFVLEDTASYWIDQGNNSLEKALSTNQNQMDKEIILKEALDHYDRALNKDSNSALGWYKKGVVLSELGNLQEALMCFNKSIDMNPRSADVWLMKGKALCEYGYYNEAINAYNQSLVLAPMSDEAWYYKGGTFAEIGRFQEAGVCYDKAIEINPKLSNAWMERSCVLKKLGYEEDSNQSLSKAIELYNETLKSNPKELSALLGKGIAFYLRGDFNTSVQCLDEASVISPRNSRIWYSKGLARKALGRMDDAENAFSKAKALSSNA